MDAVCSGFRYYRWKIPYPKSVLFIVCNEFCERFSFYGLRTILSLYLRFQLGYDKDFATVIYHVFIMLCYFFPFLGAIVADSWLGKFRTIFFLSIVYAVGNIVVSVAAVPDVIPPRVFTMLGLVLIALGTGGIKPCVSAFGGDQFVLPEQEDQLQKFFSLFYFAINSGSLLSTFITPILREDVKCFGQESCYPLAFGVPAMLMVTSLVVFVAGKKWYKIKKPEGNTVVKVVSCMWYAARKKCAEKKEHWLYKADDKFDRKFIQDIIATLRVLVLYIPLPIFWALFDQQGSRWTFQAARMDVEVGGIKIKPDQMQVVNPVLILVFIPIFESLIYPTFAKCNLLKRPLQRLVVGGLLAGAAFGISAIVEMELEKTYPELPGPGEGQLRIINTLPENRSISITVHGEKSEVREEVLQPMSIFADLHIAVKNKAKVEIRDVVSQLTFQVELMEKKAITCFLVNSYEWVIPVEHENIDKSAEGDPKVMILVSDPSIVREPVPVTLAGSGGKNFTHEFSASRPFNDLTKIPTDEYKVVVQGNAVENVTLQQGGIYALVLVKELAAGYRGTLLMVTPPNSVCILWLIPQYVVITAGEVMFSITGLEFSFTQAPISMKSLMQAIWLFTVAIGNLVVVIVAEAKVFSRQTYEFLLFGGLMILDMIIFALMAMRYTYVEDLPASNDRDAVELDSQEKDHHK